MMPTSIVEPRNPRNHIPKFLAKFGVAKEEPHGNGLSAVVFSKVNVLSSNDILGQVISEVCYAQTTSAV